MNKDSTLQDRLGSTRAEEGSAAPLAARVKMESGEIRYTQLLFHSVHVSYELQVFVTMLEATIVAIR